MSDPTSSEERIFNEAREIDDSDARAAFVEKACNGDAALRARVDALLKADHEADALLTWSDEEDSGAVNRLSTSAMRDVTTIMDEGRVERPTEREGDMIGRYKLLQQIGEGGFGVVFMAEQLEPVKRRVALKVIKLGMDTKQFVARFEAERQALAMMDHPNIAKALDAGATATGRPFFVMELVRGVRITEYCDEAKLTVEERLNLFTQVCAALQHAHQKGVIHRDIKPSNILVTQHDGVAVPKVIDFGIAKAIDQDLTDKTLFTRFEQFLGTPAYTSPEQAGMSDVDVDTRSDIYSLGILLYELLTGAPPFDAKSLMSGGFDEMRRTIQEDEPARPSTRLSSAENDRLNTVAEQRQTGALQLVDQLQGDLDWIVMKAIEKDRSRRYETSNGLALDVRRFLNNEPVLARPPTAGYRFQKMVHRNRAAVATAAAITIALLVGLVASVMQAIRATNAETEQAVQTLRASEERDRAKRAEQEARQQAAEATAARIRAETATALAEDERLRAERESAKSRQVARVLREMMKGVTPQVALGRDVSLLREIVDGAAARIGRDLKDQPLVEAELRETLAEIYYNLAAGENGFDAAETNALRALELRRRHQGEDHPEIAYGYRQVAKVYSRKMPGNLAEFEKKYLKAIDGVRESSEHKFLLAEMLHTHGLIQAKSGRREAAIKTYQESLAVRDEYGASDLERVWTLSNLGQALIAKGELDEGIRLLEEGVRIRTTISSDHPDLAHSYQMLGRASRQRKDYEAAAELFRKALTIGAKYLPEDHLRIKSVQKDFARLPKAARESPQRYADAIAAHERSQARFKQSGDPNDLYPSALALADLYYRDNRFAEAEPLLRRCRAMHVQAGTRGSRSAYVSYCLAYSLLKHSPKAERGKVKMLKEAAELFQEAAGRFGSGTSYQIAALHHRGESLARLFDWQEAAEALRLPVMESEGGSLRDLRLALLRARTGDVAGHAEVFRLMADRYGKPKHWSNASQTLRAGTAIPSPEIDPAALLKFSRLMLGFVPKGKLPSITMSTLHAAADLRAGNLDAAVKHAKRSLAANRDDRPNKAAASAVLGIVHARRGELKEARAMADAARKAIEPRGFEQKGRSFSGSWPSYLYASMLRKEADAEIAKAAKKRDDAPP